MGPDPSGVDPSVGSLVGTEPGVELSLSEPPSLPHAANSKVAVIISTGRVRRIAATLQAHDATPTSAPQHLPNSEKCLVRDAQRALPGIFRSWERS